MKVPRLTTFGSMSFGWPNSSDLDEVWMERLRVPERHRRHYSHLSVAERNLVEAVRVATEEYVGREMLREKRAPRGMVGRFAEYVDQSWLIPAKGRAVDFKGTFEVLNLYAQYRAWAESFRASRTILDLILPYWMWHVRELGYNGPGFLQMRMQLHDASLGSLGDARWHRASVYLSELKLKDHPTLSAFERDAWSYLDPELEQRVFGYSSDRGSDPKGLLSWIGEDAWKFAEKAKGTASGSRSQGGSITWSDPTADQLREVLKIVMRGHYEHRVPRRDWQLSFEVGDDLTSIGVTSVFLGRGPFHLYVGPDFHPDGVPLNPKQ